MARPEFTIKQGDQLEVIEAYLNDSVGTDFSIAGWTIRFSMRSINTGLLVVDNAPAIIVDATTRRVKYVWDADDTLLNGEYRAEFECTDTAEKVITFPNGVNASILIHVTEQVG